MIDLYFNRGKPLPDVFQYDKLPARLRRQVLYILDETICHECHTNHWGVDFYPWASTLVETIEREYGEKLGTEIRPEKRLSHLIETSENVELVLSTIELACRMMIEHRSMPVRRPFREAIDELNGRFLEHGVGFQFSIEAKRLVRLDNTFLHSHTIQPALVLLADPAFRSANDEFRQALDDYRKGAYDNTLAKCGTAFESVLKIICEEKKWDYRQTDTANTLLDIVIPKCGLEGFFTQPLMIIATLRNRLSIAHGAGAVTKAASDFKARFALNATAAAMLFLYEASR